MDKIEQVPAIGFSVTANLGGARQIVLQHFVPGDMAPREAHAAIDHVMALADRQSARYEIVDLLKEKDELERSLAQYDVDRAAVDAEFDKAQASLDVQILDLVQDKKDTFERGYNEHVATGRQGSYKPKGNQEQALNAKEAGIQQVKDQKEKDRAQRDLDVYNLGVSINARRTRVAVNAERIAELQAIIDGE